MTKNNLTIFNKDAMGVISDTPLFSEAEKKALVDVAESMEKAHANSQIFRTDTEARMSVLNDIKFPTAASKYYQSLREMNIQQQELVKLLYNYEDKKQDIQITQANIMKFQDKFYGATKKYDKLRLQAKINKLQIDLGRTKFALKQMKRTAEGRKQEILQWNKILKELEPLLKKAKIPLNNPDTHQKVSYFVRHIRQAINAIQSNSQMGVAEVNNLFGQIITNARLIKENSLTDSVLHEMTLGEKIFVNKEKILPVKFTKEEKLLIENSQNKKNIN